jgi:DNA-binding protein YbaB
VDANARIESLFEEYQRQRNSLTEMQQRMRALSGTATSPRREVTVSVGQSGVLTDIRFPTSAYKRMTPSDLSEVILATYTDAKESVLAQAAEVLAPMLPAGMDARALVDGTAGTDAYLPAEPRIATSVREILGMRQAPR